MTKKTDTTLDKLKAQIAVETERYHSAVRAAVEETLAEFGMTLEQIVVAAPATAAPKQTAKPSPGTRKTAKAKKPAPKAKTATKKAPLKIVETKRKGKYPRGPQPAKYVDPETGAMWSGRGKAPAWLGEDRERFAVAAA
jgi:DNA-binding protein H-NS